MISISTPIKFTEPKTLRFQTIVATLLVGLTVLAGCGDVSKKLAFTTPTSVTAGESLGTVTVSLQNENGKAVEGAKGDVELSIHAGPAGAQLGGTVRQTLDKGVATFKDLSIAKAGTGIVLRASQGEYEIFSKPITVKHAAPKAIELASGISTTAALTVGQPFTPSLQVRVADGLGNLATGATGKVTAILVDGGNTGATLMGDTSADVVNGVATFGTLLVDRAGEYSLRFTGTGLTEAKSSVFTVAAAQGVWLAFSAQPANASAGATLAAVKVEARDRNGNVDKKAAGKVALALSSSNGAVLQGTLEANLVNGVATFSDLRVEQAGTGYTLQASSAERVSATSAQFAISPAAAASVAFTAGATTAEAGKAFAPAPAVLVKDAFGNVTNATVVLDTVEGTALQGTLSQATTDGVASFADVSAQKSGKLTLRATAGTGTTTREVTVSGSTAASVEFVSMAASVGAGEPLNAKFKVLDAYGNGTSGTLSLAIASGPAGVVLSGTATAAADATGVATFGAANIRTLGSAYTVKASLNATTSATSSAFAVVPGSAALVSFVSPIVVATAGVPFSYTLKVTDLVGNSVDGPVSFSVLAGSAGAVTGMPTAPVTSTSGQVTFGNLVATVSGLYGFSGRIGTGTAASSPTMALKAGPAKLIEVYQEPQGAVVGAPIQPSIKAYMEDAFGNVADSFEGTLTATLEGGTAGAVLSGTTSVLGQAGEVVFADLKVDQIGTGYKVRISAGPGVSVTTAAFDVTQAASLLVYTDPANDGQLRLVRNDAKSSATKLVLELQAATNLTGFGVGFNLPVAGGKVALAHMEPGTVLPAGSAPAAAAAVLSSSGPLQNVLVSAQSQKSGGTGAKTDDSTITAGSVLYTLELTVAPGASPGTVFDGTSTITGFNGALRNRLGESVVEANGFRIGKLELQ